MTNDFWANLILENFSFVPTALPASTVRALMGHYHVTIRHLAGSMGVAMKRVREVRNDGVSGLAAMDYIEGIEKASLSAPCRGGCSFWSCARPQNHPGPCQPNYSEGDKR